MFCAGLLLQWFRCPAAVGAQGYNIADGVHVGFRSPWLAPAVRAQCLAITRNKTPSGPGAWHWWPRSCEKKWICSRLLRGAGPAAAWPVHWLWGGRWADAGRACPWTIGQRAAASQPSATADGSLRKHCTAHHVHACPHLHLLRCPALHTGRGPSTCRARRTVPPPAPAAGLSRVRRFGASARRFAVRGAVGHLAPGSV